MASWCALAFAQPDGAGAATFADGFQERVVAAVPGKPIAFDAAPDGRIFVGDKDGLLRVVLPDGSVPTAPVLDIRDHVNTYVDRGLLGVAVAHDFLETGNVYLSYVYEHDASRPTAPKTARVTRISVLPDNTVARPTSPETVILGTYAGDGCPDPATGADCLPGDSPSHSLDSVVADDDGTLWISTGDANSGSGNSFSPLNPQDERSLAGKLLHVDRDGRGLAGHPFCPEETDLRRPCTKVHAKGFRNPFRFSLAPDLANLAYVADVGAGTREELDVTHAGGNFGWPCYEGDTRLPTYRNSMVCQDLYAKEGTSAGAVQPLWTYDTTGGASILGGPQYTGTAFPPAYQGTLIVGDTVRGFIKALRRDDQGGIAEELPLAEDLPFPTQISLAPGGQELLYIGGDRLHAISYGLGNRNPSAAISADPRSGSGAPLEVAFTAAGSADPDGDPVSYSWDFGDGSPEGTGRDVRHTYAELGAYRAVVTVTDGRGGVATASTEIVVGNAQPQATITEPAPDLLYISGNGVRLAGSATDAEDGTIPSSKLEWDIVLHHNVHSHDFQSLTGSPTRFYPFTDHDSDSHYSITLRATDSGGLVGTDTVTIHPRTTPLTLKSDPSGVPIAYAGVEHITPWSTDAATGWEPTIVAPQTHTAEGIEYVFDHWTDGDTNPSRKVRIYQGPTIYKAVYRRKSQPPPSEPTLEDIVNCLLGRC